jgi:hypothetical protein
MIPRFVMHRSAIETEPLLAFVTPYRRDRMPHQKSDTVGVGLTRCTAGVADGGSPGAALKRWRLVASAASGFESLVASGFLTGVESGGWDDVGYAVWGHLDVPAGGGVGQVVVVGAEQASVGQVGRAAEGPPVDVVGFAPGG